MSKTYFIPKTTEPFEVELLKMDPFPCLRCKGPIDKPDSRYPFICTTCGDDLFRSVVMFVGGG